MSILQQVGEIPPVHWFLGLELWNSAPFTWAGTALEFVFGQQTLQWAEVRFAWLTFSIFVIGGMTLELMYWSWSWLRGRQIGYDSVRATKWSTGPRAGEFRDKPVNLEKALTRRYAWPYLGLPLYLVAVGMYVWYLFWPGGASQLLLAVAWIGFAPVRRWMFILVARKAYLANHPTHRFKTTALEDLRDYFSVGFSRPAAQRHEIDPPFEPTSWLYRLLNRGHALFSRYGTFWRLFRFWNVLRFWKLLFQAAAAFFWPISAVCAPFWYMWCAKDYEEWVTPWWRLYGKSEGRVRVIRGEVISSPDTKPTKG